jgi:predicted component of viral defense system (DUF524 family)
MIVKKEFLTIPLEHLSKDFFLEIHPVSDKENTLFQDDEAHQYNESPFQVIEGNSYFYKLKNQGDWKLKSEKSQGVFRSFSNGTEGAFNPNIFVGTFQIPLINSNSGQTSSIGVEVRSSKISYSKKITDMLINEERSEYQLMLNSIAEHSIELVMQYNVPVQQSYESGIKQIGEHEIYQRFLFVRSLFKNQEFEEAIQKIISNPATKWNTEQEDRDIRSIRRFTPKNIRELTSRSNRVKLLSPILGLKKDVPVKISSSRKIESIDTAENRFIKHILESFLQFCELINVKLGNDEKLHKEFKEVTEIAQRIDNLLNHPFFKDISRPNTLLINSPILQRRSGYRELLKAWLRFHLTAQLSWKFSPEEDNIFSGGKKDIASLYEYWVFFVLFNTLKEKYTCNSSLEPKKWLESLLVPDSNGLGLYLQEGRKQAFEFECNSGKRPLKIKFYYNRSFPGRKKYDVKKEADKAGSYTNPFRPDYTLSVWPKEISENQAEEQEKIVHIHFDAKYKIENFAPFVSVTSEEKSAEQIDVETTEEIEKIEKEERQGKFKNVDLYKMHAYKDAIRRTGGAYILYPGLTSAQDKYKGFHEIIPGVGAFSLKPSIQTDSIANIGSFIEEIITNLQDVLSQRERLAKKQYKILKDKPHNSLDIELDNIARNIGIKEDLDETYVLVGYCKSQKHYNWISSTANKYNIRFGKDYLIDGKMATAKYLVLYEKVGNEIQFKNNVLFELNQNETSLVSDQDLLNLNYPSKPSANQYLLYTIQNELSLGNFKFEFSDEVKDLKDKLSNNSKREIPFAVSLADLLKVRNDK